MARRTGFLTQTQINARATVRRINALERRRGSVSERDRSARERARERGRLTGTQSAAIAVKRREGLRNAPPRGPGGALLPPVHEAVWHYSREWNYRARVTVRNRNTKVTEILFWTLSTGTRLDAAEVYARLWEMADRYAEREDYLEVVRIVVTEVLQAPTRSVA